MGPNANTPKPLNKNTQMPFSGPIHEFEAQCLRILRCTAHALANSPGGLRFKAGTQPWLDALSLSPVGSLS